MRVLLDECVDWRLLRDLTGHDVKTARQMGWSEVKNGKLLRLTTEHFDVFVTVDRNLSFQNKVIDLPLAVIVLAATPEGQVAHVAVAFLVQVHGRMQAQGMSNAELARRIGTSAAYITRLFRGNANLSVQTMAKLALAVDATLSLKLVNEARAMTKARYGTAEKLFDALDKQVGKVKTRSAVKAE